VFNLEVTIVICHMKNLPNPAVSFCSWPIRKGSSLERHVRKDIVWMRDTGIIKKESCTAHIFGRNTWCINCDKNLYILVPVDGYDKAHRSVFAGNL
jgi:hypothetical protein